MSKFTAPQLKALKSAVETGNAWNAWGNVYRTATNRMMQSLCAQGLLTHDGRPTDKTADSIGHVLVKCGIKAAPGISAGIESSHPTLDDFAAKFKDVPMYECEIPGTPGRITCGKPGTYVGKVESVLEVEGGVKTTMSIIGADGKPTGESVGFVVRHLVTTPVKRKAHKVKRYNRMSLGVYKLKVVDTLNCKSKADWHRLQDQDAKVCAIEVELSQYEGKKRTTVRDKRVKRLVKILRRLKRGVYI